MTADDPSTSKRVNNGDLLEKLNRIENAVIEVKTNQTWIRENFSDFKSYHEECIKKVEGSIDGVKSQVNAEITILDSRISPLEQSSWYQRGFYAAIGTIIPLLVYVAHTFCK